MEKILRYELTGDVHRVRKSLVTRKDGGTVKTGTERSEDEYYNYDLEIWENFSR